MDVTSTRAASVAGALAALLVAVGTLAGCASSGGSATGPSDGSGHDDADVVFGTAMVAHHEQAIAMARLAADHAGSAELKGFARQIDAEQLSEVAQLQELLSSWGRPGAPPDSGMAAMPGMGGVADPAKTGHDVGGQGMMTDQQMHDLSAASGPAFDRLFLQMMIKHHGGAVAMAAAELSDGENADAQVLAQNISDSQQAEVTFMIQMLTDG